MTERVLRWADCLNVRDLGGHATEDGGRTRFGAVVRADSVASLTDEGWRQALDYGVRTVIDLRMQAERDADPPREMPIEALHLPAFGDWDETIEAEIEVIAATENDTPSRTAAVYLEFLERFRPNFARPVSAVANAPAGAVIVHCQGGKDRTGLVAAIMLRLADVGIDAISEDYALSEVHLAPRLERWLTETADEDERERLRETSRTPASSMQRVLAELERRYGSVAAYLEAGGASPEDVQRARSRLRG
ncbi:MAG: tyrosine-protein phosphatase [Thermoleophilia bacterium]